MVDISKILITQRKNLQEQALQVLEMAEAEGFEPPWAFTPKLFSRQPRYDRFDMPPNRILNSTTLILYHTKIYFASVF